MSAMVGGSVVATESGVVGVSDEVGRREVWMGARWWVGARWYVGAWWRVG